MFSRISCRTLLFVLALGCLLIPPLRAGETRRVIGRVVASSGAALDGVPILKEDTILEGDRLTTPKAGTALIKLPPDTQANLGEETSVRFGLASDRPLAQIASGAIVTTTSGKQVLIIETPNHRIIPVNQGKSTYIVAVLPDKSTLVAARHGQIAITEVASGQSHILAENQYAQIPALASGAPPQAARTNAPGAPQQGQQGAGKPTKPPWHIGSLSYKASVALIVGAAGGAAAAVAAVAATAGGPGSPAAP